MPGRKKAAAARDTYHHGDLRHTLIDATEALLAERGAQGFSLREVARRSGVSPAAPAHHFGDAQGLLTAVATLAFDGLTAALEAGNARGGDDPVARLREQGVGYVGFALGYPGRFALMFRDADHAADEALQRSGQAAFRVLENGVRDLYGLAADAPLALTHWNTLLAIWSVVHGFAHLAIAGQFDRLAPGTDRQAFVMQVVGPMLQQQLDGIVRTMPRR
jgi:AcrR family transcriptional regulator